ncbi:TetR/AcrR family transcriptional regulator [Nocardia mexicana]|uniref:TetR family transcriptional regulator n=1 Tax=Nocardia mexicana TaxID=279262 RepID=A0A370HAU3_9NOCA|nr:TetR/AcrR family transcriptional regulator [Nocardia mexicana]RDI54056.1 TetR family transcriptional regulator [Nocardia mexicana]
MGLEAGIDRGRLPRGTHGLDPADVVHSQRMRMYFGVLEAVAERGYTATTVADIVARASVSRRTFYQQFQGRDDCFAAAFAMAVEHVVGQLDASIAGTPRTEWRTLIRTTLSEYLRVLADNSPCARALHIECLVAGPVVAEQRRQMKTVLAHRMSAAFHIGRAAGEIPSDIPPEIFEALIGAVDDRIRDCLDGPGPAALPTLLPHLYQITLALFGVPEWPGE